MPRRRNSTSRCVRQLSLRSSNWVMQARVWRRSPALRASPSARCTRAIRPARRLRRRDPLGPGPFHRRRCVGRRRRRGRRDRFVGTRARVLGARYGPAERATQAHRVQRGGVVSRVQRVGRVDDVGWPPACGDRGTTPIRRTRVDQAPKQTAWAPSGATEGSSTPR